MIRRTLMNGGGICTLDVTLSTGVASITVQGIKYTSSTVLQFPIGTQITWSAAAATGYTVSPTGNQKMTLTEKAMQIKPVASVVQYSVRLIINSDIGVDEYMDITINKVTTRYTSTTSIYVPYGTVISWVSKAGQYAVEQGPNKGSITITSNGQSINSGNRWPMIFIDSDITCHCNWSGEYRGAVIRFVSYGREIADVSIFPGDGYCYFDEYDFETVEGWAVRSVQIFNNNLTLNLKSFPYVEVYLGIQVFYNIDIN